MITTQKDLDLPAHKVMVAHIRCKDIAREQLEAVKNDQAWAALLASAVDSQELLPSFKPSAESLIESCLYGYETEAMYFVDSVRMEQKAELQAALLADLHIGFAAQREVMRSKALLDFRQALSSAAGTADHQVQAAAKEQKTALLARYQSACHQLWVRNCARAQTRGATPACK